LCAAKPSWAAAYLNASKPNTVVDDSEALPAAGVLIMTGP